MKVQPRIGIDVHSANGEVRLYLRGYPVAGKRTDCGVGLTPDEAIRTARRLAARAREARACQSFRLRHDRRPHKVLRAYVGPCYPEGFTALLLGDDMAWYHRTVGGTVRYIGRQRAAEILREWRESA